MMPRKARKESGTQMYHVMARGIDKISIFSTEREKRRMKTIFLEAIQEYEVEIYAYCIMNNHLHVLIKSELKELSKFIAKILAEYAKYYNYKEERIGPVFQGRYKSECVETEKYFWNCLRYIHLNPVKSKLRKNASTYLYSSMREYREEESDILCRRAIMMYEKRFETLKAFFEFHKAREEYVFEDIKEEMEGQRKVLAGYLLENQAKRSGYTKKEILAIGEERVRLRKEIEERLGVSRDEGYILLESLKDMLKDN